jgi:ferredoxin--NADP+ reductase
MYEILKKTVWSDVEPRITEFELNAPEIAKAHKAGQFVIIINGETGERIPLTIADKDEKKGTISILFQEVGASTIALGAMNEGDRLDHVAGPLGKPTHVEKFGTVVCVGGGVGIAPVHPIAKAMKEAGNHVISILGARTKDLLIYEENMQKASDKVCITTRFSMAAASSTRVRPENR